MDKEDRELAIEIINEMLEQAEKIFDEKGIEHYLKFKIICREQRVGDYSMGEEITVDEIKEHIEWEHNQEAKQEKKNEIY